MIPTTYLNEIGWEPRAIIGRFDPYTNSTPDISLDCLHADQHGVSRRHAALLWRNNTLSIVDLGSSNGTFVNGLRVPENHQHRLGDGDKIRLGRLQLQLRFDPAGNAPPSFLATVTT